jgi:hypothetical protein
LTKTIVFVRGIESPARRLVVEATMLALNPNINTIRAIKLAMTDFIEHPNDKGVLKAADKSVKNIVKKVLVNHTETFILIDNENLVPQHWQSLNKIAEECGMKIRMVGVDVIQTETTSKKINLQEANRAAFKCEMHKYFEANIDNLGEFKKEFSDYVEKEDTDVH